MSGFESIPSKTLGEILRINREEAGITQQAASDEINVARTTLIATEKGQRRARFGEIRKLARMYGTSVNALLRREAVHVDLVPRFRRHHEVEDSESRKAVSLLSRLAKAEVELENLLGIERAMILPPERPILPGDVREQAEDDALELRRQLGIGNAPITDIVSLLDMEMGVRIYVRRLDGNISGLFAYDEKLGPCMMLNANHPRERRNFTAAHECGHLVSTRNTPEVLHEDDSTNSREERYADAFGRAFLMPARAVKHKFQEVTVKASRLTRRHVIVLSHNFGVSREAMVRRLEELKIAQKGTWDWFKANGGITREHVMQVLGDVSVEDTQKAEADRPTTQRLNMLAAEAYERELLSEGQLSEMLGLGRAELRKAIDDLVLEGDEAVEAPSLLG